MVEAGRMAASWSLRLTANWLGELPWWLILLTDPQVWWWLGGVEPAWTLLAFESLRVSDVGRRPGRRGDLMKALPSVAMFPELIDRSYLQD